MGLSELRSESRDFESLLDNALLAKDLGGHSRALRLYQQALDAAPETLPSSTLASILESINDLKSTLESWKENLNQLRTSVELYRRNSEARLELGSLLISYGRDTQAIQRLRAALALVETADPWCRAGCFERTGYLHFWRGEYQEAFDWFDKAAGIEPGEEGVAPRVIRAELERKILTACQLGWKAEARDLAASYVEQHGRVSRPVRKALKRIDVDADAIYIEKSIRSCEGRKEKSA